MTGSLYYEIRHMETLLSPPSVSSPEVSGKSEVKLVSTCQPKTYSRGSFF